MVAPQLSIVSPQTRMYESRDIDVTIQYREADLDTVWYRVYDRTRGTWTTEELMYVRNKWANAITFVGTEKGTSRITLDNGDYTLHVWANSTGWGDENLYQRKVVNVANATVNFSISTKQATTATPTTKPPPQQLTPDYTPYIVGVAVALVAVATILIIIKKRGHRYYPTVSG